MQAVRQLDQDDADIVDHGQQHLADAFGLAFLARGEVELAQLGDPVDAAGHLVAELLADLFQSRGGIFDHIVQEPGLEADHVHVHVGQLAGDQQGMGHVGFAGDPGLAQVAVGREAIGALQRAPDPPWGGFPAGALPGRGRGFRPRQEAREATRLQASSYGQRGRLRNGISGFRLHPVIPVYRTSVWNREKLPARGGPRGHWRYLVFGVDAGRVAWPRGQP